MAFDPVVLLTSRERLPLDPVPLIHMRIIADAICEAWRRMLVDCHALATHDIESAVTGALVVQMLDALYGRTPFSSLVHTVQRGVEQYNYNGEHYEKRPDLNFFFKRRNRSFPLAVECKIIDQANGQTVHRYGAKGIARFTGGDYGWFHRQGFMVAYVRDTTRAEVALGALIGEKPARWPTRRGLYFETMHPRAFKYVGRDAGEDLPGHISLVHVWLDDVPASNAARPGRSIPRAT